MTDSSTYSSLFALVESHLSKSLQENGGNTTTTSLNIPSFNGLRNGSVSESLPSWNTQPNLSIPNISSSDSPIQTILAQQVANMLKAKEKLKEEEEKQKLVEKLNRLAIDDEKNSVIDLVKAIQTPYHPQPSSNKEENLSRSNSVESLLKSKILEDINESEIKNTTEPILPCTQDMSHILKQKVKMAKCSSFGKIISRKWRPLPTPYFRERVPTSIARFSFNTPSPCDIFKENLRKPTMSRTFTLDITKFM